MSRYLVVLFLITVFALGHNLAFGHGVHSGISGCPVGACGTSDWYYLQFMKDATFQFTLIIYGVISSIFLISASDMIRTKIRKNM